MARARTFVAFWNDEAGPAAENKSAAWVVFAGLLEHLVVRRTKMVEVRLPLSTEQARLVLDMVADTASKGTRKPAP